MIITQTPFRMSFFGGGTDMENFFKEHGGAVLSTTFDKYCYVNVRHLPRFFDYSTELSYSKTERVTDINDIQHPAIRNAMKMLDMHEIRLTYEADLPARSGLGTSSSFAVGMLNAFYALKGKYPPLMEKPMNQKPSLHQMEHYQKFYENGEYVRAVESTTEQNYNMIDGCANNLPKPRIINGRESVLDKLRIRQMAREKQKSSQEQSADMERNRK